MSASSETLHVRVNPANRHVKTTDPTYVEQWVKNLEHIRADVEADLTTKYQDGSLHVTQLEDPRFDTPERVIHFMAHTAAESTMQRWAVLSAIGLVGIGSGYDHGQTIIYHDDPAVPLYGHEVMDHLETA